MEHIGILTNNVCLSVGPPLRFNGASMRAKYIAESIYSNIDPNQLDVICLQELVFHRDDVLNSFIHHPYYTNIVGSSIFGHNIRFVHSGLAILSKWPIADQSSHIFTGPTYHMEAFMAKAVQYAKIFFKNQQYIHVFNTHTQAWTVQKAQDIRFIQFQQINQFIKSLNIPNNELIILAGDFNLDFYEHLERLNEAMSIVNLNMCLPDLPEFSFDPTKNILVGTDDSNEYATKSKMNGCEKEYLETGICNCCPRQLIDGIAINKIGVPLKTKVIHNISKEPFEVYINISTKRFISNVSDHFAVYTPLNIPKPLEKIDFILNTQQEHEWTEEDLHWIIIELILFIFIWMVLLWIFYFLFCFRMK